MKKTDGSIKGMYRDILINADRRIIQDNGWFSNTILNGCRSLLAGFMKNETSKGIQCLAVGQGLAAWDSQGPPAPDPAVTRGLENRYDPPLDVAALQIKYLNEKGEWVLQPTSRLQITATLGPGYPQPVSPDQKTYPLREFGLFSRFGDTDYMINCIRHPVIHKEATATLIREIRLYF